MAAAAAGGYNLGYETAAAQAEHQGRARSSPANVLAEMVQRVVLNGEDAKARCSATRPPSSTRS